MVAISLYRGNLHKVPDVARRWLMPARKINLQDFKSLLRRRNRALSRRNFGGNKGGDCREIANNGNQDGNFKEFLETGCQNIGNKDGDGVQIGKNVNKDGIFEEIGNKDGNFMEIGKNGCEKIGNRDGNCKEIGENGCVKNGYGDGKLKEIGGNGFDKNGNENGRFEEIGKKGWEKNGNKDGNWGEIGNNGCESKGVEVGELVEECNGKGEGGIEKLVELMVVEGKDGVVEEECNGKGEGGIEKLAELMVVEGKDGVVGTKGSDLDGGGDREEEMKAEKVAVTNPSLEIAKNEEVVSDKQKRRQEIEEKLKILNEKKHSLVQALKQILNAEEELKIRSNIQGVAGQPPVGGGQVEGTRDSGSMSRHNTPVVGSEGNVSGEAERAEAGDANHNVHLRHLVRTSSTSPSSDTQQRKSPFVTATLPSRTNSGVANSPSRFAVAGQQGLPPNLLSVSVSGTNYAASSPSPAANGGTSAFRDRRVPSPWS